MSAVTPTPSGTQPNPKLRSRRFRTSHQHSAGVALLAPFGIGFLLFVIVPLVYAVYESFFHSVTNGLGFGPAKVTFDGLVNYIHVVTSGTFGQGVLHILLFGIINVPLTLGLALILALLLDMKTTPFRGFFRLIYFLPYAIPGVVGAILWSFLYEPQLSPYTHILSSIGAGRVNFLSTQMIIWSLVNIVTWEWTGYNMLIMTASLNAIPQDQFEAARVDGCGRFREAWFIKIPQLVPALIMTGVFSIIGTLQLFNEPFVLHAITDTVSSNYTPNMYAYTEAFTANNYYYAAAISVFLAIVTVILSFGFLRIVQRRSGL